LALWASVEAFGGGIDRQAGRLRLPAAVGVPSVLLYRVLTCWLPVFIGWPVMRRLTENEII
jgi:hypothetical protein